MQQGAEGRHHIGDRPALVGFQDRAFTPESLCPTPVLNACRVCRLHALLLHFVRTSYTTTEAPYRIYRTHRTAKPSPTKHHASITQPAVRKKTTNKPPDGEKKHPYQAEKIRSTRALRIPCSVPSWGGKASATSIMPRPPSGHNTESARALIGSLATASPLRTLQIPLYPPAANSPRIASTHSF